MDAIEKKIIDIIDSHRDEIIEFARDIYDHAELGYKEFRTAEKFADFTKKLGLEVTEGHAVTGVKAYLNQDKKDNVSLALIGELDALRITNHPHFNKESQGAHCCGHHAQLTGILGAAIALSNKEIAQSLDGQVVFFAVPAEEYGEVEFKNKLKDEGKIKYGGGKCELIRIGAFDDVDLSIAHHSSNGDKISFSSRTNNGFVSKVIKVHGKASHAAAAPELGVNALNAASLGLAALGYHRETFKDTDHVRIHPIMTKGGDLVNVIPDEVVIETLVRAGNNEAIIDASNKTDRAFFAGGAALGATVEIETMPGYLPTLPVVPEEDLVEAAKIAAGDKYNVEVADDKGEFSGGSTDVGDLQHIQPVYTFNTGGIEGKFHGADFEVVDEELAYIETAKVFALGAYRFLRDNAKTAKKIVDEYEPKLTKEKYVELLDSFIKTEIKEYN
ncbi:amidohydrolase [Butyrivibrio sp. WCD2001]|uniref:amidohydrolase n=1 Tax=Butyrivibrio sp. WCD2001 TaxID=1280681 RepID=UPI0003FF08B7|nr:amidohydrolase [Butyrivibrio sp. WCD2001]